MTIICLSCGASKENEHNWIQEHEQTCEKCWAVKQWKKPGETESAYPEYTLTRNDKLFLRSLRIDPE